MALAARACLAVAVCLFAADAAQLHQSTQVTANPVRKVVNLLKSMSKKVTEEGEREEELYKKFACYCKSGVSELQERVTSATNKSPELESKIKASEEQLVQAKAGLKTAQTERHEAKAAIAAATQIRESQAKEFAALQAELEGCISQISGAVAALTDGMAGSLLQTAAASRLRAAVERADRASDDDKEVILSFLSGKSSYVPKSGEVTGILKDMGDSFSKSLAEAKDTEATAIKEHEALVEAKTKEIRALTDSIESRMTTIGETGVAVVQMKVDFEDLNGSLLEDKALLAELQKGCSTKDEEYEARMKTRNEELSAISETIKILNDDDALELFKKTLPAPSASLVQVQVSEADVRGRAAAMLQKAQRPSGNSRLAFLVLALRGKKVGFEKIIGLIDAMVVQLKKEQSDDDDKREYCSSQFDFAEDSRKELSVKLSDTETSVESAVESIASLTEGIAEAEAAIKALDESVREATAIRKEENEEYKSLVQSDTTAKELLLFAKNRLNKFYNPKLYEPPAKKELSAQGAIERDMTSFVQASQRAQRSNIEPPPETWDAYAKKSEESNGVTQMIDLLVQDLDKELTEAETEEKNAQEEYDRTISDAKVDRVGLSKTLKEKSAARVELTGDLEALKDAKKSTERELMANAKFTSELHAECDWLLQYFDVRARARSDEVDALTKAKAVLSGADYSLLQRQGGLRRRIQ